MNTQISTPYGRPAADLESTTTAARAGTVSPARQIPLWVKLTFTAFMAVWFPVYLAQYGPTNFLYFCDMALLLTLAGLWTENRLLISMPATGILLAQALWVVDFCVQLTGHKMTGMTAYMFDEHRSLFLRGLSLFHGWLPFLLIYLVAKIGYDRRALAAWTALAWSACLISFFFLPPAGARLADPKWPVNINYVFGMDDAAPQKWLSACTYLAVWMGAIFAVLFAPAHFALRKWSGRRERLASTGSQL